MSYPSKELMDDARRLVEKRLANGGLSPDEREQAEERGAENAEVEFEALENEELPPSS